MDLKLLKLNIEHTIPFGGKCIKLFGFHFIGCILSISWDLFSDSPLHLACGWILLVGGNGMGCEANGAEHDHPLTPGPAEQRDQMATVLAITLAAAAVTRTFFVKQRHFRNVKNELPKHSPGYFHPFSLCFDLSVL